MTARAECHNGCSGIVRPAGSRSRTPADNRLAVYHYYVTRKRVGALAIHLEAPRLLDLRVAIKPCKRNRMYFFSRGRLKPENDITALIGIDVIARHRFVVKKYARNLGVRNAEIESDGKYDIAVFISGGRLDIIRNNIYRGPPERMEK